ncbi:MAG TPA: serpin family protein, partial [Phycisphaerae bacterium]|nr:serpin family protein [Phycisphaerae bacterium]
GRTAQQMADVLHITQPGPVHHATFGELIARLSRDDGGPATGDTNDGSDAGEDPIPKLPPDIWLGPAGGPDWLEGLIPWGGGKGGSGGDEFTLRIANSLWGRMGYPFLSPFLETLEGEYGSPLRPTDFRGDPEESRRRINGWVSDNTNDRIPELIPEGTITKETLLVLANAIYFNASWKYSFPADVTETFHLPAGDLDVEMMRQIERLQYLDGDGFRAVQLPYYNSDAAMLLIVPDEGQFESFEASFSVDRLDGIVSGLRGAEVRLTMPKFECRQKIELCDTLEQMGMADAFDKRLADFTGMSKRARADQVHIGKVIHEAWLSVDEDGTEAAAATAVMMLMKPISNGPPPPPIEFTVDRPFLYLIRDTRTGTTLFMGRINDAAAFGESDGDAQHGHDDTAAPQPPRPDPGVTPFPVRPPVQVSLASLGEALEQHGGGQAGPSEIAGFRQSLVTLPRLAEPAARRLLGANSLRWRRAAAGVAGDEGYVKIDALDLHPARQASLPGWMTSVLSELNGKAVLLGIRGDAL